MASGTLPLGLLCRGVQRQVAVFRSQTQFAEFECAYSLTLGPHNLSYTYGFQREDRVWRTVYGGPCVEDRVWEDRMWEDRVWRTMCGGPCGRTVCGHLHPKTPQPPGS